MICSRVRFCSVLINLNSIRVYRYKDGKELKSSDKYDLRHEEKDYALFVSDVTDADVGVYECRAKNSEGECSATAEVMIASEYGLIWNV